MEQLEGRATKPSTFHILSEGISSGQLTQLEFLYKKAPIGFCILDRDLRYISINETLALINGRAVEEHIGRTFFEVIPEVASILEPVYRNIIETGESALNFELSCPAPANPKEDRHWLLSLYPLKDEHERVQVISTIVQDITVLKSAQTGLRQSRWRLHALVESTKALPWIANAKTGQFTYVGPKAEEFLGYPIESWYEENFWLDHILPKCLLCALAIRDVATD